MVYKTKIDACGLEFIHHMKTVENYIDNVFVHAAETRNKRLTEFATESLIIRITSYFEGYLKCLVQLATFHCEDEVRAYFLENGNVATQNMVNNNCSLRELLSFATREVSFKNRARKLKRIFQHLFGISPFPDEKMEDIIHDAVLIRNIIVHESGIPNQTHANQMKNPGIIIVSNEIFPEREEDSIKFYKIEHIKSVFIKDFFYAIGAMQKHIQRQLERDPKFSFIKRK